MDLPESSEGDRADGHGSELDETVARANPGQAAARWGGLELREKLGEGAYGEVFRAWDARLEREVALKLLKPAAASGAGDLAARILHEGRLLARVSHPNVVRVHGVEVHDGRVGLWMEIVQGRALDVLVAEQGTLGDREAALIGVDLCRALVAVHRAGLLHRDIKAGNVMRENGGRIVLMDFGAGAALAEPTAGPISGTPLFMAPEVWAGDPVGPASDIYSLGVLLFHLVTGSYPVRAPNVEQLRALHRRGEGRLLRDERPDLPQSFVSTVERALAREPSARFASAGQMEQALSAALSGHPVTPAVASSAPTTGSRRWILPLTLGGALLLVVPMGWIALDGRRDEPVPAGPPPASTVASAERDATREPPPDDIQLPEIDAPPAVAAPQPPVAAPPPVTPPVRHEIAEHRPGVEPIAPPVAASYTIEASLLRAQRGGNRRRIDPGALLAVGDRLSLEFRASHDLYVYVINRDDHGRAFVLFPLPALELGNPLPGGVTHALPGNRAGRNQAWLVDTPGGREHFLVLASPERLVEFEAELGRLPRPAEGAMALEIPVELQVLRGVGGLVAASDAPQVAAPASRLFEMAERLAGTAEVVQGVWLRQIVLDHEPR